MKEPWEKELEKHDGLSRDARLARAENALRNILAMHDGNQPAALNLPDLEYARRVIRNIHAEARNYFENRS
jgi:hypothetical protein